MKHSQAVQSVLPEALRQQYLKAMDIQTWYDPALEFEPNESSPAQDICESSVDVSSQNLEQNQHKESGAAEQLQQQNPLDNIDALNRAINQCQLCELHTSRKQAVPGEGNPQARLLVICDAPVDDAAASDVLFETQDKQMLQAMLQAINIDLASVYLTSLVKCQPPEQRAPYTSEMICCDDYLSAQIKLIQPEVIMILGEQASQQLLVSQKCLTDLRLRQHQHLGVPVYASYHPRELYNSAATKSKVWQDLLQLRKYLA